MMHQKDYFPWTFVPEVKCHILELPYVGKKLSMLIILPERIEDDSTGLLKLEQNLTFESLTMWTQPNKMQRKKLTVGLPRFKLEETYDLNDILVNMGMVDLFDAAKCDLSGIAAGKDLVLSKVVHKAFVEVNEKGTEAAAATVMEVESRCYVPPQYFIADHPFLFFIRHNPTNSILFYGCFCSP
uniref:Serpin B6 n=1 Tax=Scleropages formosus TaxID=113540 RepID=A0A8C9RM58_SCLFO